jgi:hypothetical protein
METKTVFNSDISFVRYKPEGYLSTLIDYYVLRHIRLSEGSSIVKYMPCKHTNSIDFYLGERYDTTELTSGKQVPFIRSTIRGPRTYKKYQIRIFKDFLCFSIKFKPAGIYQLFGIPMDYFRDEAVDAEMVHPKYFRELTERLMNCHTIQSAVAITESFLLHQLNKKSYQLSAASKLADLIMSTGNSLPVNAFYEQLPLTARQLERNFVKEIGVTPKTFSGMVRFENLIAHRINQPQSKWTELAYAYNYFDQMHLIKDFHKYLDINPGNFTPNDFAF